MIKFRFKLRDWFIITAGVGFTLNIISSANIETNSFDFIKIFLGWIGLFLLMLFTED